LIYFFSVLKEKHFSQYLYVKKHNSVRHGDSQWGSCKRKKEEEKIETTTSQPYYYNAKPVPLEKDPIEHLQQATTADLEMTAYLEKEFGEKLNALQPDVVTRFVRGYAHDKERQKTTVERLRYCVECFEKNQFTKIADSPWTEEEECLAGWPVFIYGTDHQGHPLLYDEIGCSSPTQMEASFGGDLEKLRKFRLRLMRRLAVRKENLSKKHGVMIYKHVMVMDVSAASMSSLNRFKNLVQSVITEEQHLFPETLYKLYIINAPWTFRAIWAIVSNFVDPITYQKVHVLSSGFLEEMLKIMNKDQIPEKYGGTCKRPIVYGQDSEEYQNYFAEGEETQSQNEPKKEEEKQPETTKATEKEKEGS